MCGIVGIAGALEFVDQALIKRMLIIDYIRGTDATGVARITKDGKVSIAKMNSHPWNFFDTTRAKETLIAHDTAVFIGHNRAKTRGDNNEVNAHPFTYGSITGVHNGTLDYESHTLLEDTLGEKFEVDSMALFASIDKFGIKDTIKAIRGAWSLAYYDARNHTLNLLRNSLRPMWIAYDEDKKRLYYASEWPLIKAPMELDGVAAPTLWADKQGFEYFETSEDVHLSFDLEGLKEGKCRPKTFKLAGKVDPPPVHKPQHDIVPWQRQPRDDFSVKEKVAKKTRRHVTTVKPYAGVLEKDNFDAATVIGCGWCGARVEFGDPITYFEKDFKVLGKCCSLPQTAAISHLYLSDKTFNEVLTLEVVK